MDPLAALVKICKILDTLDVTNRTMTIGYVLDRYQGSPSPSQPPKAPVPSGG